MGSRRPILLDGTMTLEHYFYRWSRLIEEVGAKRDRPLHLGPHIVGFLRSASFADIREEVYAVPLGSWPRDDEREKMIGSQMMMQTVSGMEGYTTVLFTTALGWSAEETAEFVEEVKREITDDGVHKICDFLVACGIKEGGGKHEWRLAGNMTARVWRTSGQEAGVAVVLGVAAVAIAVAYLSRRR
ncbi:hypothetical protein LTR66_002588 [Elasticomyces elasticus]|nr:hypothetical protein LTR50_007031 [Elasticomyces elasticus]KAK4998139.1 hypothetical protein LTR66_002588 [Elasticomyces elasticus]